MLFFFFNDTATTEIYTLSLHDALPISPGPFRLAVLPVRRQRLRLEGHGAVGGLAGHVVTRVRLWSWLGHPQRSRRRHRHRGRRRGSHRIPPGPHENGRGNVLTPVTF